MRYVFSLIAFAFVTGFAWGQGSTQLNLSTKDAEKAYYKSDAFVFKPSNDSLIALFKAESFYKKLPGNYNDDSLRARDFKPLYPVRMIKFVPDSFYNIYEPGNFTPFCYEYDKESKLHGFYIHIESMPATNGYRGVSLFICDENLNCIDYFILSETWLYSGSAGSSTKYQRLKNYDFNITENSYDIDYDEKDDAINYLAETRYQVIFSNGKHEIINKKERSWTEKVNFNK